MRYLITIVMIIFTNLAVGQIFKTDKWCENLITDDVVRFSHQHFPPPPFNQPTVYVRAVPLTPKFYAITEKLEDGTYMISVNILYLDKPTGLERTLIHELVHVLQFHNQMLGVDDNSFYYDGECYSFDTPYYERPWEIEAFELSDKFCD